jgi:hypothetical protein
MGSFTAVASLLALFALIWFILKKFASPQAKARAVLQAYGVSKERGIPEQECLFQIFDTRPPWNNLPKMFLRELATRLHSKENVVDFVIFSERTGILQTNILKTPSMDEYDLDSAFGGVATALIGRAHAFGSKNRFHDAKAVLEWILLLHPSFLPAWSGMAVVAFQLNDHPTALHWAEKVLNHLANTDGDNLLDREHDEFKGSGGSEKTTQLSEGPGRTDKWNQVQQEMETIRDACSR